MGQVVIYCERETLDKELAIFRPRAAHAAAALDVVADIASDAHWQVFNSTVVGQTLQAEFWRCCVLGQVPGITLHWAVSDTLSPNGKPSYVLTVDYPDV